MTYFVIVHGESLSLLEDRIQEFSHLPVKWASMSTFDIPQKYILKQISKTFDVVFDCSTVKNEVRYELDIRLPRLMKYLEYNKEHKYICTKTDRNNLTQLRNRLGSNFNTAYKDQIIYVEDLGIDPNPFCVSLHLFLASLYKLGATKIVLFGADGGGTKDNSITSYYKWKEVKYDKEVADNLSYNMIGDSNNINCSFSSLMQSNLGFIPTIYNCSPYSKYTVFKNITLDEAIKIGEES